MASKPLHIRPLFERQLDDVLEAIDEFSIGNRVKDNRQVIKSALGKLRLIDPPATYSVPIKEIKRLLSQAFREAAKHQGIELKIEQIASMIDGLIAELQHKRKKQDQEMKAVLWLSH